jgi:uncharacterized protein YecE (DUF72 family)
VEIERLLAEFNVAFCIYELAGFTTPWIVTADFIYVRLHGPGNKYQGLYGARRLRPWARAVEEWIRDRKSVYFYFDNDQAGYAARDAMRLREMTGL